MISMDADVINKIAARLNVLGHYADMTGCFCYRSQHTPFITLFRVYTEFGIDSLIHTIISIYVCATTLIVVSLYRQFYLTY